MDFKTDRLQVRIHPGLKKWFDRFASTRGGMSKFVQQWVEELHRRETGSEFKEERDDHPSE